MESNNQYWIRIGLVSGAKHLRDAPQIGNRYAGTCTTMIRVLTETGLVHGDFVS